MPGANVGDEGGGQGVTDYSMEGRDGNTGPMNIRREELKAKTKLFQCLLPKISSK